MSSDNWDQDAFWKKWPCPNNWGDMTTEQQAQWIMARRAADTIDAAKEIETKKKLAEVEKQNAKYSSTNERIDFAIDELIEHENEIAQRRRDGIFLTGFIDPGGQIDDYFLTVVRTDTKINLISVMAAQHWKLNEKMGVDFAYIRKEIAKIHNVIRFDILGCEYNNYGREQIQAFKREHSLNLMGINTVGKITSDDIIRTGQSMDKHQIIRWTNIWRQKKYEGLEPHDKIVFPKQLTPELKKIVTQLDTFIVKRQKGTGNFVYEAEGTKHDDGVMSLLGNFFIVKTKILTRSDQFVGGPIGKQRFKHPEDALTEISDSVVPRTPGFHFKRLRM